MTTAETPLHLIGTQVPAPCFRVCSVCGARTDTDFRVRNYPITFWSWLPREGWQHCHEATGPALMLDCCMVQL